MLLILSLLLVMSSATAIMSTTAPGPPCLLGVHLALIAPCIFHDVLCLGYALRKNPAFTRSLSVQESLMLNNHDRPWVHMCVFFLQVGYMDLFLTLKLEPIVIHVVAAGVTILQYWKHLLRVGVCRLGSTSLSALVTGRMLLVCVEAMYPRLMLMTSAVVSASASFTLMFFRMETLMCLLYCPLLRWLGELYRFWWWYRHQCWGGREVCHLWNIICHLLFLWSHHRWSSHFQLVETAL